MRDKLEAETGGHFDPEGILHTRWPQKSSGVIMIGEQSFWSGSRVFLVFPRKLKSGHWAWLKLATKWKNDFGPGKYYEIEKL